MIYNFLSEYLSIIIFLFIALFISIGFIVANYLASPSNPDPENYQHTNVASKLSMIREWSLMLDFI